MELFEIVDDWKPLTIITKCAILDVAAVLDPLLVNTYVNSQKLVLFHGYVKKRIECLCFSDTNIVVLKYNSFLWAKINGSVRFR